MPEVDGHSCAVVADSGPRQRRFDDSATTVAANFLRSSNSLWSSGPWPTIVLAAFVTGAEVCKTSPKLSVCISQARFSGALCAFDCHVRISPSSISPCRRALLHASERLAHAAAHTVRQLHRERLRYSIWDVFSHTIMLQDISHTCADVTV
jgi:hypothetical protein